VVSLDAIRRELGVDPADDQRAVVAAAKERARVHLRAGERFVWNATNVTRFVRGPLIGFFAGYGARVRVVYVETNYATLTSRNAGARVPRAVVERLIDKLDVPDLTEAHGVEYVVS
jgi:predicted kinase